MKKFSWILFLIAIPMWQCTSFPEYDTTHELLFQTGFEGSVVTKKGSTWDNIVGTDTTFTEKSNWEFLCDGRWIKNAFINYEDGSYSQRYAKVVADPEDNSNSVLMFKILEPHIIEGDHKKGRVSAILETGDIYSISQTLRLYLHPTMVTLKKWDRKVDWLTIFEFWSTDYYRITVSMFKSNIPNDEMYFKVSSGSRTLVSKFKEEWSKTDTQYPIPFGEWFTISLNLTLDNAENGRLLMEITDSGQRKNTIFDLTREFGNPEGFTKINPMKLYTSDSLIEYLKKNNSELEFFFDDWKFYRN